MKKKERKGSQTNASLLRAFFREKLTHSFSLFLSLSLFGLTKLLPFSHPTREEKRKTERKKERKKEETFLS